MERKHEKYQRLLDFCKSLPPTPTAVAHPCDESSLRGAVEAAQLGLIAPILVGPRARIEALAKQHGIDLANIPIVDAPYSEASAAKAVELVREGKAEALMKGSLHTDELMGAVVRRETGLRTARRVSHCFVMDVPSYAETLIVTDAAVNIAPTLEDKVHIIQNAIDLAHAMRFPEVRVAILSAMETVNPKVPSTIEAAALCKMADRGQITGALLDGPLALDNAISLESVKIKKIDSPVAGRANVLVVPDLEAGNMLAKSLSFLAGADAAGIVLGARVPDHPDEPRRLGDDAARLLRHCGAGRARASGSGQQGQSPEGARHGRRNRRTERGLVELQVLAVRRQRARHRARRARAGGGVVHISALSLPRMGLALPSTRSRGVTVSHWGTPARSITSSRFLRQRLTEHRLVGVGHRVVHGGPEYAQPVRVDASVLAALEKYVPLAPLHQPHNLAPIRALLERLPQLPQIACFDTAFHRGQPPVAQAFALPKAITERGVIRYGFHGLSYEYVAGVMPEYDSRAAAGKVVVLHLGNGSSMCAIAGGRSVASTMGFTAADGLPMGTRCGNLDPGVVLYLMDELKMDARAIEKLIYQQSGLLGVSGISSDMRTLEASNEPGAKAAIDLYVYRIGRELGSLAAALGGLDAIVFTAGIGENSR